MTMKTPVCWKFNVHQPLTCSARPLHVCTIRWQFNIGYRVWLTRLSGGCYYCYKELTRLLGGGYYCYKEVTRLSGSCYRCYEELTRLSGGCYYCYKELTRLSGTCYHCYKELTRLSRGCYKVVTWLQQPCNLSTTLLHACHKVVTTLHFLYGELLHSKYTRREREGRDRSKRTAFYAVVS